ncbi:TPA: phage tail protein [Enterobacter cloacae]|uniref:phage tail-collar fiber domain-containing protein n=1 Tax=Enterobacter cloacae TaxID=550 RepID=UPI00246849DD|nr:phage tail protein [Enterobacter cloacae]WGL81472.1 phage tail protein [Enterobacter cloacae]HCQ7172779.1 phage tail protein [Enterobacter cloacae]HDR2323663.1 phage tail protein [Enterobacter kobei]
MTVKYKTVITKAGAIKLAAATIPGGKKVNLTAMAVGDGGGTLPTPDPNQTKLVKEVWRHALNKISQDRKNKNYVVAELLIPPETGGFWMRELGLYDDTGTLIAVGNMAESYKPALAEGSGRAQTVRMVIMVSDIESVELTIDISMVMATQDYVDNKLAEHEQSRRHPDATLTAKGFTQLSSATDSVSESVAATPKAVKAAYDLAKGKYTAQDATTAQKGIVQLSSATDSASEGVAATPKAVKAAYDLAKGKYTAQDATTAQKGIVQLSSATDSTSEALAATPKAVKAAIDNASGRVPSGRKVNGRALTSDISITAQDIFNGQTVGIGNAEDLNAYTTPGLYYQPANAQAQTGKNYPEAIAGSLEVFKHAGITQIYRVYNNSRSYIRTLYSGTWSAWTKQYDAANKPSPADINAVNKGGDTMTGLLSMNAGASVSSTFTFKNGSGIASEKTGTNPRNGRIYWGGDASRGNRVEFADDSGWKAYIERHPANGVQLIVNGRINGSIIYSSGEVQAGGGKSRLATDGNIFGSKWGEQWLDVYLKNTYQPKGNYTPAGQAYTKAESDGRFQPKGSYTPAGQAYTKAESDNRFQKINTASKAVNGWFKDTNTGLIYQWGRNTSTVVGNATVTFPIAFPNACLNLQNTWIRGTNNPGQKPWGFVTSFNNTSASLSSDASGSFWYAVGY